ncbi:MAG: VPLPA-CTERM sorting domain-containing protein [Gammaproteobacteria bacterium]
MKTIKIMLASFLLAITSTAFAASLTFEIGNHADGALYDGSTNPYGLRLDDLGQTFTVGDNLPGAFTGASLTLTFDPADLAAGAVLTGTVIDNATGLGYDVNYMMTDLTAAPNGGFISQSGTGTLNERFGEGTFVLASKSNGTGSFIFDNDGHRIDGASTGWVGRGWFEGSGANDFLITGTSDAIPAPVPLPAAIWLMGAGLVSLFGFKRRQ